MDLSRDLSEDRTADPAYRKVCRALLTACIVLAPLTLAAWFALCPQYGNPACPSQGTALEAFRAANPLLMQIFLLVTFIAPYVYPMSYIGLGLLAFKGSPWLAMIGVICGWVGSIPWGFVADQMFLLDEMARLGNDALFATLIQRYFSNWETFAVFIGWVLGHLLGYVLLGIALARARAIPLWAASLLVIAAPLMGPLAYPTHLGILQVLGYILVLIGSIPAALAMLKSGRNVSNH